MRNGKWERVGRVGRVHSGAWNIFQPAPFFCGFSHVMQFISWIKEETEPNKNPQLPWKMKSGAADNWNINLKSRRRRPRGCILWISDLGARVSDSGRRDTAAEMKEKLSIKRQNVDYYLECSGAYSLIITLRFIRQLQRSEKWTGYFNLQSSNIFINFGFALKLYGKSVL